MLWSCILLLRYGGCEEHRVSHHVPLLFEYSTILDVDQNLLRVHQYRQLFLYKIPPPTFLGLFLLIDFVFLTVLSARELTHHPVFRHYTILQSKSFVYIYMLFISIKLYKKSIAILLHLLSIATNSKR